ncbi:MAG: chemotaxis protein CheA [Helicobacteraceae bacterium]|nr:chemotaxis protein CheA [Helicobacteraceae bacterium]
MGIKCELEENFDFEIVDQFLDHFSMMLEVIEPLVIDMSKKDYYKMNVDELFRIFHNIKSSTGYLQLTLMTRLAKLAEDELEEMRLLEGPANQDTIDWLIRVGDIFTSWQHDILHDKEKLRRIDISILRLPDLEKK